MNMKHLLGLNKDDMYFDFKSASKHVTSEAGRLKNSPVTDQQPIEPVELVVNELDPEKIQGLISSEHHYAQGLRIVLLRALLDTGASSSLVSPANYATNHVLEFLGFSNYERFAQGRTYSEIKQKLKTILGSWEDANTSECWFPSSLSANLDGLAQVVGLNATDKVLLGFAVLLHAEPLLEQCTGLMGSDMSGVSVHLPLGRMLSLNTAEVEAALGQDGRLHQSGLLTIDLQGRYSMKQLLDLMTHTFHSRMLVRQSDIRNLVAGFVKPASATSLAEEDYRYISQSYVLIKNYLRNAMQDGKKGANILVYGVPGTGKSQLARTIAKDLGATLMEISPTNLAGEAVTPMRRIRSYGVAQSFYRSNGYVLLFDEVEEVLALTGIDRAIDEARIPQKSFLNALLENNRTPTIWIANNISEFDPAYIRRFDICFEMPVPPLSTRMDMLKRVFKGGECVSDPLLKTVAKSESITPAMIEQAALVANMVARDEPQKERERLLVDLFNSKLRAQGGALLEYSPEKSAHKMEFDPCLVNCEVDLERIMGAIMESQSARICLYGPPGTGKTAFGKWMAEQLGMPHMVLSGSSLISKYVGDTEKNIAQAFAMAKRDGAVIQIDEVDGFLFDRGDAKQQYESSRVNEMLVQMEKFDGIFIASTNFVDKLDEASLRRFDMAIKFDFIRPDAAVQMFNHACSTMGLADDRQAAVMRIRNMRGLTPGDFEQVLRRARLAGLRDSLALVDALEQSLRLKKTHQHAGIGFLRAA